MNILVLGGHGFIGSHIVENLIVAGHTLRVFARRSPEFSYNAEWFPGDFHDKGKLSEALVGIDVVVHCISTTVPSTSASDPVYDIESNLIGTVELLRLMDVQGVRRLIYLSSGGTVYGNPHSIPVPENAPLNPICNYGAVKVAIEKFIEIATFNNGLQSIILRPSNPFGERQGHKGTQGLISTVLNNMITCRPITIFGDGETVRDYLYVKDVADLVTLAVVSKHSGIYNAGSGVGYSIHQIIDMVEDITAVTLDREYKQSRGCDVRAVILNNTRANQDFGWTTSMSLRSGIKKYYNWLKTRYDSTN